MNRYAIVDIETTGGSADRGKITEIAIRIWDGTEIIESFESLVNPQVPIPLSIQALTGINNEMVVNAPKFGEIATVVFEILSNKIFVAHNVNFDYSFMHHALLEHGLELKIKKLCTVRLSRKILPGLVSYSLGRLTESLSIKHYQKHRAGGDADATVLLFKKLQESDWENIIPKTLKKESQHSRFPINLDILEINSLPEKPGVYYFKDEKDKVIYVGKALNLKKRIISHFSGNSNKKQRQDFIQKITRIQIEEYPTELMALIYESQEIKRLWPFYNKAQKVNENRYGIYSYLDQKGFLRLGIDKKKLSFPSSYTFSNYLQGIAVLKRICEEFDLIPELCSLGKSTPVTLEYIPSQEIEAYNNLVQNALRYLSQNRSFAIIEKLVGEKDNACILVLKGEWIGTGRIDDGISGIELLAFIHKLKPIRINNYIRETIFNYALQNPGLVLSLGEEEIDLFEKDKSKNKEFYNLRSIVQNQNLSLERNSLFNV